MMRAESEIDFASPTRIAGRVCFPRNPAHRPVLHLCEGWRLIGSRLAGDELIRLDEGGFVREFQFVAEEMGLPRFTPETVSIVVAETGERILQPTWRRRETTVEELLERGSRPTPASGRSFEDALLYGYCAQDVVQLLFTDYLGRPADDAAISDWAQALRHRSSINDLVLTLIQSPEYAARRLSLGSLPGRIFDNDLLYLVDRSRMKDLQDVSYQTPIRDMVVDLSPLAGLDLPSFMDGAFRALLMRPTKPEAVVHFGGFAERHGWTQGDIAAALICSEEFDRGMTVGGFDKLGPVHLA